MDIIKKIQKKMSEFIGSIVLKENKPIKEDRSELSNYWEKRYKVNKH